MAMNWKLETRVETLKTVVQVCYIFSSFTLANNTVVLLFVLLAFFCLKKGITWKGHPNVHSLSYKRIQHTFGTSNHSWPNLSNFSFRVGTIVDSDNLCRMLQRTKQLRRLYLHRNINMNANDVIVAISSLPRLTHLVRCYFFFLRKKQQKN